MTEKLGGGRALVDCMVIHKRTRFGAWRETQAWGFQVVDRAAAGVDPPCGQSAEVMSLVRRRTVCALGFAIFLLDLCRMTKGGEVTVLVVKRVAWEAGNSGIVVLQSSVVMKSRRKGGRGGAKDLQFVASG